MYIANIRTLIAGRVYKPCFSFFAVSIYLLDLFLLPCLVPSGVAGYNSRVSCSSTTSGTMARRLIHCVAFYFHKVVT